MSYQFNLEENEAAFVLQVIGNLPTQTGAFPLFEKLQEQVKAQMPTPAEEPAGE